jgi:hypothetical protein
MIISTPSFKLAVYMRGDKKSDKLALAMPGLLDTKDYAHLRSHVDFLATKGFLALSFDPPGTWESPGDISLYTVTNYLKAINELIEHFGNKPTFLMGHSRGATMSMFAGCTNPHVFAFAPVMSTHINGAYEGTVDEDWKKAGVANHLRDLPPGGGQKVKPFALPYSFFEDQIKHDMTEELSRCTKPKLFIYGNRDDGATPERVKEIYDIAAEPKEIYELDSDHNYRFHKALIDEVNRVVGKFLDTL